MFLIVSFAPAPHQLKPRALVKMLSKIIPTAALLAGQAAATIYYAGVAESGGEFGVYSTQVLIQSNQ